MSLGMVIPRRPIIVRASKQFRALAHFGLTALSWRRLYEVWCRGKLRFCKVANLLHALKVAILRPKHGIMAQCGFVDQTVRKRKPMASCVHNQVKVDINNSSFAHTANRDQRMVFVKITPNKSVLNVSPRRNNFKNFVDTDDGHNEPFGHFDGMCKILSVRRASKVFQPSRRIDHIEARNGLAHARPRYSNQVKTHVTPTSGDRR
jgi:hypothetical protein